MVKNVLMIDDHPDDALFFSRAIVMYSTSDMETDGPAAADVGATVFMIKPTTYGEVKARLSGLMYSLFGF